MLTKMLFAGKGVWKKSLATRTFFRSPQHCDDDDDSSSSSSSFSHFLRQFLTPSTPQMKYSLVGYEMPLHPTTTSPTTPSRLINDILGNALLMAVPKRKTTRSKTRIKNYRKRIVPDVKHIQICELCGETKLRHILCKCVVDDDNWKEHRDDNSWLNAGNANNQETIDSQIDEVEVEDEKIAQ